MSVNRSHLIAAGVLLTATAVAGIAARGSSPPAPPADPHGTRATAFSAATTGPVRFTGTLDRTAVQLGRDGIARMELVIAGAPDDSPRARRPTDLVVVLDRSGSMMGDKMVHARAAVLELLGQLGPQDRFALVTYSDLARTDVDLLPASAENRASWAAGVTALRPDGGTNMSAGLDTGLELVERGRRTGGVPRLILISDGLANQGDPSLEGLTGRARRAARGEYMLSTVGVGSDFNEELMTALADAGTGNYYYVADPRELGNVFAREFDAARTTIASGLTVRIQPGAGVRVLDAGGYPLDSDAAGVRFHPGALFAGQERRIWVTLGVPQSSVGEHPLGTFALEYDADQRHTELRFTDTPRIACVASEDEFYAGVDVEAWGRGVVVDAYNKMQADVAREVKKGERDTALQRMQLFSSEAGAMNARLNSPRVAQSLDEVSRLTDQVGEAFRGDNQEGRQNALSKAAGAVAVDARRAGAKK